MLSTQLPCCCATCHQSFLCRMCQSCLNKGLHNNTKLHSISALLLSASHNTHSIHWQARTRRTQPVAHWEKCGELAEWSESLLHNACCTCPAAQQTRHNCLPAMVAGQVCIVVGTKALTGMHAATQKGSNCKHLQTDQTAPCVHPTTSSNCMCGAFVERLQLTIVVTVLAGCEEQLLS